MTETRTDIVSNRAGGHIATVTFDNEAKLNSLSEPAALELAAAIRSAGEHPDLRALIFRGAGDKAMIGGADINYMKDLTPDRSVPFITSIHRVCDALRSVPVPVIARVSGYCLGAGLEVAVACDIRIADARAQLGMPEVQVGLPSVIEAALLPRLIGWGRCAYLVYTGEPIDAGTAERWGLVERVVAASELDAEIGRVADAICRAGPRAIRLQKMLCRDWEELPLRDAIQRGIDIMPRAFAAGEPRERLSRFFDEK